MYICKICGAKFEKKAPTKSQSELVKIMNEKGHLCYSTLFKEQDNINQNRGLKQIEERKNKKPMTWYCFDCDTELPDGYNICPKCGGEIFEEREKDEMI